MIEVTYAYVAIHTCGLIVAAIVDSPEHKSSTAGAVSGWLRAGHLVDRQDLELVKTAEWCKCFQSQLVMPLEAS